MAKNELRTDGKEIVEAILTGKLKKEIEKEFRISEEELATTLLPLYRAGHLTKEEFNSFFKGKPVQRVQEPPTPEATEPADKPRPVKEPSSEAPEYSVSGTFKKFTEAAQEEPIEEETEEESLEMEEIDFEEEVDAPLEAEVIEESPEPTAPEPPEAPEEQPAQEQSVEAQSPAPPAGAEEVEDFQDMRVPSKLERTLDKIWKRLDSIDRRLHEIGKKLDV